MPESVLTGTLSLNSNKKAQKKRLIRAVLLNTHISNVHSVHVLYNFWVL